MTTEPTGRSSPGAAPPPARSRRRGVPARVRIIGWLMLLMAVVLVSVIVVTQNLLLRQVETVVRTSLEQEANEFSSRAEGEDHATRRPYTSVGKLLRDHLQRQFADDDEVLVGALRRGDGWQILRQDRDAPLPLHQRRDLLDPILASSRATGSTDTDQGELRWAKVLVRTRAEPETPGAFVVGYLIDRDRAEVDDTIRTLVPVSLLGLVLTGAASWLIAGRILAPVRLVTTAAAQISEQDLTRRIPVEGTDEFAALSAQFNEMLGRLERAFADQRRFLDDASHELRTPITIVRGHLELLDLHDPAERAAVVRLCTEELDRMSRMVEDLLLLAKAERPDFVQPRPVEVAELTSDIYAKICALGDRRWRLDGIGEGVVTLDPQRVTQAMVQLAHNAVKHTDNGTEIRFGSALDDRTVSFVITDHGPGVRPDDAKVIFDRHAKGSNAAKPGGRSGAGLGLAIVRAIAEAHHGDVRLSSIPGHGAAFGIELPANREVNG